MKFTLRTALFGAFFTLAGGLVATTYAQMAPGPALLTLTPAVQAAPDSDAWTMSQWLSQPELVFDSVRVPTTKLREFYASRNFQPIWVDASGLNDRGRKTLDVLEKAGDEGVNPALYALRSMHQIASEHAQAERRIQVRLSLEILMSNAVMRYAGDMQGGFTRPQWDTGHAALGAAEQIALLKEAAGSENTAGFLQGLAPQSPDYLALKKSLQNYQDIAARGGWSGFMVGAVIKPGASDARVENLRQILTLTQDLPTTQTPAANAIVYDAKLVDAVKHFQLRHSIEPDGVVNMMTQQALSVPVAKRIEQIAMTLERMRWMPRDLGNRYVLVNVPAYRLRAVMGSDQLAMGVIVGKRDTQTPMFSKNITQVVFNPSWGVPQKIAMKEMLPKVQKNPNYLINAGYTVTSNGQVLDPHSVDWSSVGSDNFTYAFRQNPGDGNALGKVKFTIPDSDNIYLHDTSQHQLFSKADRSMSHGCVRLSNPEAMTKFVLSHEGWEGKKIETAYNGDVSRTVTITPLPVHLVYWTSWVDEKGAVHFQKDIYGKDQSFLAAIHKPVRDDVRLAMNSEKNVY